MDRRAERKEQTRRAILDAALSLSRDSTLAALSLRQVAREVGIVPAAFYRHFDSVEHAGLVIVEESLTILNEALQDLRTELAVEVGKVLRSSVEVITDQMRRRSAHFAFIARESFAGPPSVRVAIRTGLAKAEQDLAEDLATLPATAHWREEDVRALAALIVESITAMARRLVRTEPGSEAEAEITRAARLQLTMMVVGAAHWHPRESRPSA